MPLWLKLGHWVLNAALLLGTLMCFYLALLGRGENATAFNRVMTFIAGVALGYFTYRFTKYTLDKG